MTPLHPIVLLIPILGVEILIPWNIGFIRSRSDGVTGLEIFRDTVSFNVGEVLFKLIAYGLLLALYLSKNPVSAIVLIFIGGVNLFYLKKGQPKS